LRAELPHRDNDHAEEYSEEKNRPNPQPMGEEIGQIRLENLERQANACVHGPVPAR